MGFLFDFFDNFLLFSLSDLYFPVPNPDSTVVSHHVYFPFCNLFCGCQAVG